MKYIRMKINGWLERLCVKEYIRLKKNPDKKPKWWFRLVSKLEFKTRP